MPSERIIHLLSTCMPLRSLYTDLEIHVYKLSHLSSIQVEDSPNARTNVSRTPCAPSYTVRPIGARVLTTMCPLPSLLSSLLLFLSRVMARRLRGSHGISIKHPVARVTSSRSRNQIAKTGIMLQPRRAAVERKKNADGEKRYKSPGP